MATTQTFGGGVHPREIGNGKSATQSQQIVNAAAPARVTIAMAQHGGAPAVCCVKVGQIVNMGQMIGEAQGFISAPVHASVSGKVVAITTCTVASGKSVPAVVIENDFEDRWDESVQPCANVDALSAGDIASIAARCGIVGMGGAAFPTNVKLDTSKLEEKPDTLIVNGGVSCAKVGIEDNKPDAIAAMREAASDKQNVEVVSLPARYPQGFEKTLIYSLTGRIVPNGKLPSAAKCVVMNVGTCAALSAAVRKGQPLIDRVVTVTGRVAKPTNFRVRIGTPLLDLIDQVGGLTDGVRKLIVGGAMMGNAVSTLNLPITKNFGGFLALGEEAISAQESACIRCGRCMRACPMKLAPAKIDSLVRHGNYDGAIAAGAMNCMECGSCTYACPAKRELTQSCRVAKAIARTKAKKS